MSKLTEMIQNLERVNLSRETDRIIKENEDQILDLIRQDQLYEKGEDAEGRKLPMPYSPFTIEIKKLEGQPIDRITLKDTGDFYNAMKLIQDGNNFKITSLDWKKDKLIKEWGNILNLQEKNMKVVIWSYVYPELIKSTRNALRL